MTAHRRRRPPPLRRRGSKVNVIDATVQSIGLGTSDTDSVVVMKGAALGLGSRVPTGNFNRLNNSGFVHVQSVIESKLDPAFAPAQFVGMSFGGHMVLGFSTGTKSATVVGGGAHTVLASARATTSAARRST